MSEQENRDPDVLPLEDAKPIPPSRESRMHVVAKAYDHWRIMRDSARRAKDYLERVQNRGGDHIKNNWFASIDYSEGGKTDYIGLPDLMVAVEQLVNYCNDHFDRTILAMKRLRDEYHIDNDPEQMLAHLVEGMKRGSRRGKTNPMKKVMIICSKLAAPRVYDSLNDAPDLEEGKAWEYVGDEIIEGQPIPVMQEIDAQCPLDIPEEVISKYKPRRMRFQLKSRPKENK